jgi:hypothetical protein
LFFVLDHGGHPAQTALCVWRVYVIVRLVRLSTGTAAAAGKVTREDHPGCQAKPTGKKRREEKREENDARHALMKGGDE